MFDKLEEYGLKFLRFKKKKKIADLYEAHKEGMRYLIFGVLSTIVNIIVATLSYYLFFRTLDEGIRVNLSTILSIIAAWIFAYITNKLYVFDSKTENIAELLKEILSFVGCRAITALVEIIMMNVFVTKLHFNYLLMKIVTNIVVIILNFVFSKLIIFKKKGENNEESIE